MAPIQDPNPTSNTFTLEILLTDHPPALLGLDTLSLSLPTAASTQRPARAQSQSPQSQSPQSSGAQLQLLGEAPQQQKSPLLGEVPAAPKSPPSVAPRPPPLIKITNIPTSQPHLLFASASLDTGIRSGFWIFVSQTKDGSGAGIRTVRFAWDGEKEVLQGCELLDGGDRDVRDVSDGEGEGKGKDKAKGQGGRRFGYGALMRLKSKAGGSTDSKDDDEGESEEWQLLTRFLTPEYLERIIPRHQSLQSIKPSASTSEGVQIWPISTLSSSNRNRNNSTSPTENNAEGDADLSLTQIELLNTFPPHTTGRERTQHVLDKSWYLSTQLSTGSLLAEFSFSFLTATILGTSSTIQHWKDILSLTLRCRSAVADQERYLYFVEILHLLKTQLAYLGLFGEQQRQRQQQKGEEEEETPLFDSETELASLGDLLFEFGRGLRESSVTTTTTTINSSSDTTTTTTPLNAVRQAYLSLAEASTSTSVSTASASASAKDESGRGRGSKTGSITATWNLAGALLATGSDHHKRDNNKTLQRRILRGVEGFGFGVGYSFLNGGGGGGGGGGWGGSEEDDDDEEEEEGPVVLDLEGLLSQNTDGDGDGSVDGDGDGGEDGYGPMTMDNGD